MNENDRPDNSAETGSIAHGHVRVHLPSDPPDTWAAGVSISEPMVWGENRMLKGRRVYSLDEMRRMDCPLPPEPESD